MFLPWRLFRNIVTKFRSKAKHITFALIFMADHEIGDQVRNNMLSALDDLTKVPFSVLRIVSANKWSISVTRSDDIVGVDVIRQFA